MLCFHSAVLVSAGLALAAGPEVTTTSGAVRGDYDDGIAVFRGIPYAAPPVGPRRWRLPKKVKPWPGVRDATDYGPICMQRRPTGRMLDDILKLNGVGWFTRALTRMTLAFRPAAEESEDCLYLNVRTPELGDDAQLPVMVWIHGGGHQDGSGSFELYNTNVLPERGVVLVTINYRLGIFGYFAHPELSEEARYDGSGNYGLFDQIAALRWVRSNIAAFGGDPGRVTIFGESAGGHSVGQIMSSRFAKGLFHRAIAQSGSGAHQFLRLKEDAPGLPSAESVGLRVAEGRDLETLRALDAEELVEISRVDDGRDKAFHPCVDGTFLMRSVAETFARGEQAKVPLLVGSNSDEGRMFYREQPPWRSPLREVPEPITTLEDYRSRVRAAFGDDADRILDHYRAKSDDGVREAAIRLYGESYFVANGVHLAASSARTNQATYLYYFTRPTPNKDYGALHAAELDFVFDGARVFPEVDGDRELKNRIADYWVAFAKSGDPNGDGRPQWSRFDPEKPQWMILDHESRMDDLPNQEIFDIFDRRRFGLMGAHLNEGIE